MSKVADPLQPFKAADQLNKECEKIAAEFWAKRKPLCNACDKILRFELSGNWAAFANSIKELGTEIRKAGIADAILCPKLDDAKSDVAKLALEMLRASIRKDNDELDRLINGAKETALVRNCIDESFIEITEDVLREWRSQNQESYEKRLIAKAKTLGIDPVKHFGSLIDNVKISNAAWGFIHCIDAFIPQSDQVEKNGALTFGRTTATIVMEGKKCFSINGGQPRTVADNEACVLQAFLRLPSMDTEQLRNESGVNNPGRVLRKLVKKWNGEFEPAIDLPGKRGNSGYRVRVHNKQTVTIVPK